MRTSRIYFQLTVEVFDYLMISMRTIVCGFSSGHIRFYYESVGNSHYAASGQLHL